MMFLQNVSLFSPVFFNLFAAVEPYVSVKITHGNPWHVIREFNGVGKVKFLGCLEAGGVERQKTCGVWGLGGAKP